MRGFAVLSASILLFLIIGTVFLGCGGGGTAVSAVASIRLTPTAVSLNRGATAQIIAQALDANNNTIGLPTLTYNCVLISVGGVQIPFGTTCSASDSPISVSSNGLICAGQWDANFINCHTTGSGGNSLPVGTASITATAPVNGKTITSSAVVVTDHERIDSVTVVATGGPFDFSTPERCVSQGGTAQFSVQAFNKDLGQVPSDTIGSINWTISPTQVGTVPANGATTAASVAVSAATPGQGTVVASIGPPDSVVTGSAPFTTCPVASVHVQKSSSDNSISFTAPVGSTITLAPVVVDSKGATLSSTVALSWFTSQPALASVSLGTVGTIAPGTAEITAACLPPSCNVNLNQPVYSDDAVTAAITGTADSTVLVATSTGPNCSATAACSNSNNIVPIDTTTNNPGTALTLPAGVQVNSMVITPAGNPVFLGTVCSNGTTGPSGAACSGLLRFDPTASTVAAPVPTITGKALATDGNRVVVADPTTNQVFIVTAAGSSVEATPQIKISSLIAPNGATENGNTVTLNTIKPHGLVPGQFVLVAGVGVAGYNGEYKVGSVIGDPTSSTSFTYTDANSGLAASGGGYATGGVSAAITPDGSKIYIVTGQGFLTGLGTLGRSGPTLNIYNPALFFRALGGAINPTSTQAASFFATGAMAYVADSAGDDVIATCNDAVQTSPAGPVPVSGSPTHIAAVPDATAMVDANSPNIDEVDARSSGGCPPMITNTFTTATDSHPFPNVSDFTAKQLIVTPDSRLAIILADTCTTGTMAACTDTSHQGVLVYDLGSKQTSVVSLGGAKPISGAATPDSANLYVGATDGKVHRIDLKTLTDAQNPPITVNLCPSVTAGCNPDFVVVKPVATAVTLSSIAVTPANPSINVGDTQQFTATGTFSDKTTRDMTNFVTWASSNTVVAIIGPTAGPPLITAPGSAQALAAGTTTITASSAGVSGSTTLTVK